jgi:hypothetical protein
LFKATAGTGEAFRTSDVNSNWDKLDAEAVAADARLDVIEANNWVTTARVLNANVTAEKLAATLDLSGKTVSVAAPTVDAHVSTKKYVDDKVATVAGVAWTVFTPTIGTGWGSALALSSAAWTRSGKSVILRAAYNIGASIASGTDLTITLPIEAKSAESIFTGSVSSAAGTYVLYPLITTAAGVSKLSFKVLNSASTYASLTSISPTVPTSTWVADSNFSFALKYEGV